jgi:uncharacterized protein (TIGR03437 family)
MRLSVCLVLGACSLAAQPYVNYRGVVNAASFTPPGLPAGAIAQGSIFSIFGSQIGPATPAQVSTFPLAATLAGVSVSVTQGTISVTAYPIVVSAGQVNAIMPSNAPLGRVSIRVTYNGTISNPSTATVTASSFGIFSVNSGGFGPGVLQNFVTSANQPINSLIQTAAPGQAITLWGTGLGPVTGADNVAPTPGNLPTEVEIFVGGVQASSLYSGRSPCCSGVDQIVFTVPAGVPLGCYVPVQIRTAGTTLSNSVTIALQTAGRPCSDADNPLAPLFAKGGNVGVAALLHSISYADVDTLLPVEETEDYALISSLAAPGGSSFFNPVLSLPPVGTCTTYTMSGSPSPFSLPGALGGVGRELDTGASITITGSSAVTLNRAALSPFYADVLGTSADSLVINTSGSTSIAAPGGAGVGKFQVNIPAAPALNWTNQQTTLHVARSQPLNMTWSASGLQNELMLVIGSNYDQPSNGTVAFVCTAPGSAGTFSVPAFILSALSASRPLVGQSTGEVGLVAVPARALTAFQATGLDTGFGFEVVSISATVLFQ